MTKKEMTALQEVLNKWVRDNSLRAVLYCEISEGCKFNPDQKLDWFNGQKEGDD